MSFLNIFIWCFFISVHNNFLRSAASRTVITNLPNFLKMKKKSVLKLYLLMCLILMYYKMYLDNTPSRSSQLSSIIVLANNVYHQKIDDCLCSRKFMYPPLQIQDRTGHILARLNSSCSDKGTHYQAGQNVITFTLFAKAGGHREKEYLEGTIQNLKMMRKYYPGYSLRLYTNQKLEQGNPYCSLVCNNSNLFWCNIKSTPSHGDLSGMVFRTWRFMTLGDPTVDVIVSRDLDSLISAREAAVVQDWLSKGDKAISVMRDIGYGYHSTPVLAGMWQASNNKLGMANASGIREKIISLSKMKNHRGKYSDQKILNEVVFYPRAKDIVAYDAYYCAYYRNFTEVRPFPTQREVPSRDFVGNVNFASGRTSLKAGVCPMECRPDYGKNWTYC